MVAEFKWGNCIRRDGNSTYKTARVIGRISAASDTIQTIDNETAYLIIYCLNCIRRNGNSTRKMGLRILPVFVSINMKK